MRAFDKWRVLRSAPGRRVRAAANGQRQGTVPQGGTEAKSARERGRREKLAARSGWHTLEAVGERSTAAFTTLAEES